MMTIVREYPHEKFAYCFDSNWFRNGDKITDGTEEYNVLSEGMPWAEGGGRTGGGNCFYVYVLDRDVSNPIGKTFTRVSKLYGEFSEVQQCFVMTEGTEIKEGVLTVSSPVVEDESHNPYCPECDACGHEGCCSPLMCTQSSNGDSCRHYLEILKENYRHFTNIWKLKEEFPNNYDFGDAVRNYINQL